MQIQISPAMLFLATLVAAVILLLWGRALLRVAFHPARRLLSGLAHITIRPIYRTTLRPIVRLIRRNARAASHLSGPAGQTASGQITAAPYKAIMHIIEMSSLAATALGEVPTSVMKLVNREGLLFRSINANRAVTLHDSLTLEEARANMTIARKYYEKLVVERQLSPSILYEDSEEALIIDILRDADIAFFWVLRRITRNVGRNIIKMLSIVTVLFLVFVFSVDAIVKAGFTPGSISFGIYCGICVFCLLAVRFLRYIYSNSSRFNGQYFNHFVQTYFSRLLNQYKTAAAAFAKILNDRTTKLDALESDSSVWFLNMHWLSERQWLLELYVRNITFQISRDWLWYVFTVPMIFFVLWLLSCSALIFVLAALGDRLGLPAASSVFTFSWSWWTVGFGILMAAYCAQNLTGLLERFWSEFAMDTWSSYRDMEVDSAVQQNIAPIVREVVDKRRNPYGQQIQPQGPPG